MTYKLALCGNYGRAVHTRTIPSVQTFSPGLNNIIKWNGRYFVYQTLRDNTFIYNETEITELPDK